MERERGEGENGGKKRDYTETKIILRRETGRLPMTRRMRETTDLNVSEMGWERLAVREGIRR